MFDRVDPALLQSIQQERTARLTSTPFARYQYVTVTWRTAGEVDIAHALAPSDPLDVQYMVVSTTTAMTIYQSVSGAGKATPTTVWLTSNAAGTARILLFIPETGVGGAPATSPAAWNVLVGDYQSDSRPVVSAEAFGATGDGVTDDQPAFAAANAAATALGGASITFFKGTSGLGTFRLGSTLTISQHNTFNGPGGQQVTFTYAGSSSAMIFEGARWGVCASNFYLQCSHVDANGIEVQGLSRHARFECVDVVGANSTSGTGAGWFFNAVTGFSFNAVLQSCGSGRFKYGIMVDGVTFGDETWTVIQAYGCSLTGFFGSPIVGSAGIYTKTLANCVGSLFEGGTIESFDYIQTCDGDSKGFSIWLSDAEDNTNQTVNVTDAFTGAVFIPQASYKFTQVPNGLATPASAWFREKLVPGGSPITESYYPPQYSVYNSSGAVSRYEWRYGGSVIKGDATTIAGALGIGGGATQTTQLPYYQIGPTFRQYVHNAEPTTGVWTAGTVVQNLSPDTGAGVGIASWVCVTSGDFAGTPPVFKAIPFDVDFTQVINPGAILTLAQYEVNVSIAGWGFTTGNAFVQVAPGTDTTGLQITCTVISADTARLRIYNPTAGTITPASSTWKFRVTR